MIDFPKYKGTDEEIGIKMFDKINKAILNVEAGIGIAGGSRNKKKYKI